MELTQDHLKLLLHYDAGTGIFTWLTSGKGRRKNLLCGKYDNKGYRIIVIQRKDYKAHRLAFLYMTGAFPEKQVDHIDGDRGNNAWSNLRAVTQSENLRNTIIFKRNTSGAPNVHWNKAAGKWRVIVCQKYAGSFSDKMEAVSVAQRLRKENGYHENHGRRV